ncbi:MAG: RHS repeat-associated core domain-containing protein [Litorimonas sp.]
MSAALAISTPFAVNDSMPEACNVPSERNTALPSVIPFPRRYAASHRFARRLRVYDAGGALVHVDAVSDGEETDYVSGPMGALARYKDGQITYIHNDHLGSAQSGTTSTGSIAWHPKGISSPRYAGLRARERYTPFGSEIVGNTANDNQAGFTGHIKDSATGLNYMQARYYDPVIGRFLSVDPVGFLETGDPRYFNRYAYTANDPINLIDPTGECFASRLRSCAEQAGKTFGKFAVSISRGVQAAQRDPESFKVGVGNGIFNGASDTVNGAVTLGEIGSPNLTVGQVPDIPRIEQGSNEAENFGMAVGETGFHVATAAAVGPKAATTTASAVSKVSTAVRTGQEFAVGSGKARIAPFGNRGPGRFHAPHYHRQRINPRTGQPFRNQGLGRHRPWDTKAGDTSWKDRF